jgi:hypothetical protein
MSPPLHGVIHVFEAVIPSLRSMFVTSVIPNLHSLIQVFNFVIHSIINVMSPPIHCVYYMCLMSLIHSVISLFNQCYEPSCTKCNACL